MVVNGKSVNGVKINGHVVKGNPVNLEEMGGQIIL